MPNVMEATAAWITAVTPLLIEGGSKPTAFFANGQGLTPEIVERLELSLKFDAEACALQFVGAASSGFTCVFNPPGSGMAAWRQWHTGDQRSAGRAGALRHCGVCQRSGAGSSDRAASARRSGSCTASRRRAGAGYSARSRR